MATAKSRRTMTTPPVKSEEVITITQVVGMIVPDEGAEASMLVSAYSKAAEFIQENAGDQEIHLTWTYAGGTFDASYTPAPVVKTGHEEAEPAYAREY
jgi:hypothetical protein